MDTIKNSLPLTMADTPDSVINFFIRVTRLKIEDLEGEIIIYSKQLNDMKIMYGNNADTANSGITMNMVGLENLIRSRIKAKKAFKTALVKLQKHGENLFRSDNEETENDTP